LDAEDVASLGLKKLELKRWQQALDDVRAHAVAAPSPMKGPSAAASPFRSSGGASAKLAAAGDDSEGIAAASDGGTASPAPVLSTGGEAHAQGTACFVYVWP
jgi:hypothetical protein